MAPTGTRRPRRGSRLCRRWALKWREDGQLLGQRLHATKCEKLSDRIVVEDRRVIIEHVIPTGPVRLQTEHHGNENLR
jgi:hypothetical protein